MGSSDQRDDHRATADPHNPEFGCAVFRFKFGRYIARPAWRVVEAMLHLGVQASPDEDRQTACSLNHGQEHSIRVATNDLLPFAASTGQSCRIPSMGGS